MIKNMTTKQFSATVAKAAFALATVVMMSMAFTACSSDNDDPKPDPEPELKANTVTLDGIEKPVLSAEYDDKGYGNYYLFLNLDAKGEEYLTVGVNKMLHITGSAIDLAKKEPERDGPYWLLSYITSKNKSLFITEGRPSNIPHPDGNFYPVFVSGTLTVIGDVEGTMKIVLKNGRVKGEDGKEHTITASYSGTMTKLKK